ncbi:MAG TPA: hypothetical protein DIS94_05855 [Bacteroidetes bacterium]|nr:hypothetical protein [Bacteroidota bacterium]
MKKLLLFLLLIVTLKANAGDRTIFIERFTSSTCPPCATNNPILDSWLATQDPAKVQGIAYHMNWPAPGNDPMYLYNTIDNTTRRTYYNVNSIPQGRFDGTTTLVYNSGALTSLYDQRVNQLSPLSIFLTTQPLGTDSTEVTVQVYCETAMENPNVSLQIAVLERLIQYVTPPGTNGETSFHDVMRRLLPGGGTVLTLTPGQMVTVKQKFYNDPNWNAAQVKVVAWVQRNDTKEVIQSGQKTADFTLLPNPGYRSVAQGQVTGSSYTVSTPVIAQGYNSPITFSAEVIGGQAGISVQFPGGNVLSDFSQSLPINVNSLNTVPAGVYLIKITGTNAQGKSHITVVNYLVGTNFVTVSTNKPGLIFNVNGNQQGGTQLYNWGINTTQTLEAITPQTVTNTRYIFTNWSSGETTPIINPTISASVGSYIANYKTQFRVATSLNPGGIPVTVNGGGLYYDSSTAVNISLSSTTAQYNGKTYYFQRWLGAGVGSYSGTNPTFTINSLSNFVNQIAFFDTVNTSISNLGSEIPDKFQLYQNYPNPFNPATKIKFDIPQNGQVLLKVFDMLGKEIATLNNSVLPAGKYVAEWNASNFPSGVYFFKLETTNFTDIKRMVLVK